MRNTRKGFTLIELLIVVTIMASLAAMMAVSSSDAIDTANANAILGNLHSMKVEAYDMYMNEPKVAKTTPILNTTSITLKEEDTTTTPKTEAVTKTLAEILGERLGRKDLATGYSIVGDNNDWFVVYTFQADDSAQVKNILKDKAEKAGLYGGTGATAVNAITTTAYYQGTEAAIALKVR